MENEIVINVPEFTICHGCEAAYRRGFTHGVNESIHALDYQDADSYDLEEWLDFLMDNWRYKDTSKFVLVPPYGTHNTKETP